MRLTLTAILLCAAVSAGCTTALRTQTPSACLAADDSTGEMLTGGLTYTATDTSSTSAGIRRRLGIPLLTAGDVVLVTDDRTCRRAIAALNATQGVSVTGRRTYVARVGRTRYAVYDPADPAEDPGDTWQMIWFYDSKFVFVGTSSL